MSGRPRLARLVRNERGMALAFVLLLVAALLPMVAFLMSMGSNEAGVAANHVRAVQARYAAEAGLEDAFNALRTTPSNLTTAPAPPALATVPGLTGPGANMSGIGTYTVQYQSAGPNAVTLIATGTSSIGNATARLHATLTNTYTVGHAILTGGHLSFPSQPNVSGSCGRVHSNANITISGSPSITGTATASGTFTVSGNPTIGGGGSGNQAYESVPVIDPLSFYATAASTLPSNQVYKFKENGQVFDGAGTLVASVGAGNEYRNFKYEPGSPTKWTLGSDSSQPGTYLFESDLVVSGNPGSVSTPWQTTLLATGTIELSGNPTMTSHLTDTALVAGKDIKVNSHSTMQGLVAAAEQVQVAGEMHLTGAIIAQDASSAIGVVLFDEFNGNATINCEPINPPLAGKLRVVGMGR